MKASVYNHTIPLTGHEHLLVNTISGAIDIFDRDDEALFSDALKSEDNEIRAYLAQRGYIVPLDTDEQELVEKLYSGLQKLQRQKSPLKFVIVVTFSCNLQCSYCWQQHRISPDNSEKLTLEKVEKIYQAIEQLSGIVQEKSGTSPLVQIFGGEPLLMENYTLVEDIMQRSKTLHFDTQIVTNGVNLHRYQELILEHDVKEVQITVDGTADVHNKRRLGSDYHQIMNAMDNLLQKNQTQVKLRVNIDHSNLCCLKDLADEIIDRRWYTNKYFYAYLAPLRDSSFDNPHLINKRKELLETLFRLRGENPQIELFDILGWDGYQAVKVLEDEGRFPYPKPNICEVNLNQFIFSPDGNIYLCAEEAHGDQGIVGQYFPSFVFNQEAFERMYYDSPLKLERCQGCSLLPICGGGCRLLEGQEGFLKDYCHSVKQCFEQGVIHYLEGRARIENCPA